jgi:hypothetical protein
MYTNYLFAKEERDFSFVLWDEKATEITSYTEVDPVYKYFTYVPIVMKYYFVSTNIIDVYDYKLNYVNSTVFNNINHIIGITHSLNANKIYVLCLVNGNNYILYGCDWNLNILTTNNLVFNDIDNTFVEGLGINVTNNNFYILDTRGRLYEIILTNNILNPVFTTDDFVVNTNTNLNPYKALKVENNYVFFFDKLNKQILQVDLNRAKIVNMFEISSVSNPKDLSFDSFNKYFYVIADNCLYQFYWNRVNQYLYELENNLTSGNVITITDDLGIYFRFFVKSYNLEYRRSDINRPYYQINIKGTVF